MIAARLQMQSRVVKSNTSANQIRIASGSVGLLVQHIDVGDCRSGGIHLCGLKTR